MQNKLKPAENEQSIKVAKKGRYVVTKVDKDSKMFKEGDFVLIVSFGNHLLVVNRANLSSVNQLYVKDGTMVQKFTPNFS
jgi:archaeosine-15-forming tRNA-guanine transglycosylase